MTGLTKQQAIEKLKTSLPWLEELIAAGALQFVPGGKPRRRLIDVSSLETLREGEHYVACPACGEWLGQINHMHSRSCLGLDFDAYLERFPGVRTVSDVAVRLRAKTPAQREAQSLKLKARFQTPDGELTRRKISDSSKVMQASESGDRSKAHLRRLNADPQVKAQRGKESKARWDFGTQRSQVTKWHTEHREESLTSAQNARRHSVKKRTKLHLGFKDLMVVAGLTGFQTEYEVGYYALDEALPEKKIAVEVMGCYWHSCQKCGYAGPKNTLRVDKAKRTYLTNRGWVVLDVWEHEIRSNPTACLEIILAAVTTRETQNGN